MIVKYKIVHSDRWEEICLSSRSHSTLQAQITNQVTSDCVFCHFARHPWKMGAFMTSGERSIQILFLNLEKT